MQFLCPRTQQCHTVFAAGYQQCAQIQVSHQFLPPGDQLTLCSAGAHHRLKLMQVRGQQGGAPVAGKVGTLGVYQYRNTSRTGCRNQRRGLRQGTLTVVG